MAPGGSSLETEPPTSSTKPVTIGQTVLVFAAGVCLVVLILVLLVIEILLSGLGLMKKIN